MAKTIADLAARVLQKLFVLEESEEALAPDANKCAGAFGDMVDGFFADGLTPTDEEAVPTTLVEGVVYTTASAFPFKARHFEGMAAMLAVSLAPDFDATVKPEVYSEALTGRQRIDAAFMPSMVAQVDRTLRRLPSSVLWPSSS